METLRNRYKGQQLPKRILFMLGAVIIMGFGVSLFVLGAMGADPFSTMNLGVSSRLGLSFGTWQALLNVGMLVFVFFIDRSKLGLGTVANMFLIGFSADFFGMLFKGLTAAGELSIALRVLLTLCGVAAQIIGCSFYVSSRLGMAPYDCVSYIVPERTGIPFFWWRILLDLVSVGIGFFCGAAVGLGTVIMAFGTGPLLTLFNKHVAEPILAGPAASRSEV